MAATDAALLKNSNQLIPQGYYPTGDAYKATLVDVNGNILIGGDIAHDAADSGNPLKIGGKASTSEPAAVADADRVNLYVDANGYLRIKPNGDVAHDAADSGNPIKVGFKAESTTPAAVADGDRSDWAGTLYGAGFVNPVTSAGAQVTGATGAAVPAGAVLVGGTESGTMRAFATVNTGQQVVTIKDANGNAVAAQALGADGITPNNFPMNVAAYQYALNQNGTYDRLRNNTEGTLLASAARTTAAESAVTTNYNARGILLTLNITANPGGAETINVSHKNVDAAGNGRYVSFPVVAAATNAIYQYMIYPAAAETIATAGHEVMSIPVARSFFGRVDPSGAGSWTYSLTYSLIL